MVLDPSLIPSSMDVVNGDHYSELKIEKEKVGFDENGDEVELDFGNIGEDGEGKKESESEVDKSAKRAKPIDAMEEEDNVDGDDAVGAKSSENNPVLENKIQNMATPTCNPVLEYFGSCSGKSVTRMR